ncbi:acyltransferase family protein [Hyalangium rubrum]|uniref:Heparan-alpha-glucosaminide N-acetyltransferase domain-containing protein n=1 Tax=Hyalangium rubrum TaxID=3103134 RepID=A0ABU5H5T6_9BACT|nr:acyltransferase family protein [Hyalangium sp. s54d21]MDY7228845.1 heparan-alpha-glucosaminide N-acetyltransferase domain-containing protein [Hyalangium sp. s54d21]
MQLSDSFNLRPPRHPALDGARGFAVMAMVLGHTLDALLAPATREHPWVQYYWSLRGITAPLFLLVSGWAVVAALDNRPGAAKSTYGRRVRRALLLLFLGYLLHWPGWEALHAQGWSQALRVQFFSFDALQCIGVSLLLGATVLALTPGTWSRAAALAALAVGIPLGSALLWGMSLGMPTVLHHALGAQGSPFPLFPWAGFFFIGALAAHLLRLLRPGWPQGVMLALLGGGLLGLTHLFTEEWSPTSVWVVVLRSGQGLLVLAAMNLVPQWLARLFSPLGRLSLGVYVLHLPVVYGWAGTPGLIERVGPTLGLDLALLVGVGLLAVTYFISRLGLWLRGLSVPWRVGSTTFSPGLGSGQRV